MRQQTSPSVGKCIASTMIGGGVGAVSLVVLAGLLAEFMLLGMLGEDQGPLLVKGVLACAGMLGTAVSCKRADGRRLPVGIASVVVMEALVCFLGKIANLGQGLPPVSNVLVPLAVGSGLSILIAGMSRGQRRKR